MSLVVNKILNHAVIVVCVHRRYYKWILKRSDRRHRIPKKSRKIRIVMSLMLHLFYRFSCIPESNLSCLCTSSSESRAWCSLDAESSQALRQTVGASTGQRECSIPTTILFTWRHQPLLPLSISITLCLSPVFSVAAPLPPQAWTLLAAQMVQR